MISAADHCSEMNEICKYSRLLVGIFFIWHSAQVVVQQSANSWEWLVIYHTKKEAKDDYALASFYALVK
jgi:hypothetical protein